MAVSVSSYISWTTKKSKFLAALTNSSLLTNECLGFVHTTHNPLISPAIAFSIITLYGNVGLVTRSSSLTPKASETACLLTGLSKSPPP